LCHLDSSTASIANRIEPIQCLDHDGDFPLVGVICSNVYVETIDAGKLTERVFR